MFECPWCRGKSKHDPGLADTLAIMSNPEIEALLEEGDENVKQGKGVPFDQWLDD
jgi:hypothetical protein